MPAVLERNETTGQNYKHRIQIRSLSGGPIVKVIDETLNIAHDEATAVRSDPNTPTGFTVT